MNNNNSIEENSNTNSEKSEANKRSCLQPMPKVLVSCRSLQGEDNILAVGYCSNCSFAPPMIMVGIVPSRYSHKMIKESGVFVVNLVEKDYKDVFDYMGSKSKRDIDKIASMKVKLEEAKTVNAPALSDCPVNIECKIVNSIVTGSHELFFGEILHVSADNRYLDGDGNIDFSKINFLL